MLLLLVFPIARRQDIMCDDVPSLRMKTRGAWLGGKIGFPQWKARKSKDFYASSCLSSGSRDCFTKSHYFARHRSGFWSGKVFRRDCLCSLERYQWTVREKWRKVYSKIYWRTWKRRRNDDEKMADFKIFLQIWKWIFIKSSKKTKIVEMWVLLRES